MKCLLIPIKKNENNILIPIEIIVHFKHMISLEIIIFYHKVREWNTKYQLKDKIRDFLPLYEIPIKTLHRLEIKYQLKAKSIEIKLNLKP